MDKPSMIPVLRNVARELERDMTELNHAQRHDELSVPPRQDARDYVPPDYRQYKVDAIDPIIRALLTHLPPPGDVWPKEARKLWLDLLTGSFGMIYREVETTAPVQLGNKVQESQ